MDSTASDYIRHRLQRYESSIDQVRASIRNPSVASSLPASAPYAEQCAIPVLLESLAGNPEDQAELRQEYLRITGKLEVLARESGPRYRAGLFKDLSGLAHAYHAFACHAGICNLPGDAAIDPCKRQLINLLLKELREDHDVSGIEALLSMIDENLRRSKSGPKYESGGSTAPSHRYYTPSTETGNSTSPEDSRQISIE